MQNHDVQNDKINSSNPIEEEKNYFRKVIEGTLESENSQTNTSLKQIKIKKQEDTPDKTNNTPIYIIAILVLSMLCGVLGGMYFQQKEKNKELNSKINEQSQIIYDYKFGTLP